MPGPQERGQSDLGIKLVACNSPVVHDNSHEGSALLLTLSEERSKSADLSTLYLSNLSIRC